MYMLRSTSNEDLCGTADSKNNSRHWQKQTNGKDRAEALNTAPTKNNTDEETKAQASEEPTNITRHKQSSKATVEVNLHQEGPSTQQEENTTESKHNTSLNHEESPTIQMYGAGIRSQSEWIGEHMLKDLSDVTSSYQKSDEKDGGRDE